MGKEKISSSKVVPFIQEKDPTEKKLEQMAEDLRIKRENMTPEERRQEMIDQVHKFIPEEFRLRFGKKALELYFVIIQEDQPEKLSFAKDLWYGSIKEQAACVNGIILSYELVKASESLRVQARNNLVREMAEQAEAERLSAIELQKSKLKTEDPDSA